MKTKENENTNLKRYMHPYVYWNIIYNSQIMEAAHVAIERRKDKEGVHTYTHNGLLFSHKNLAIYSNMDGSRGYNTKSVRERQIPYDSIHIWSLRNKEKRDT